MHHAETIARHHLTHLVRREGALHRVRVARTVGRRVLLVDLLAQRGEPAKMTRMRAVDVSHHEHAARLQVVAHRLEERIQRVDVGERVVDPHQVHLAIPLAGEIRSQVANRERLAGGASIEGEPLLRGLQPIGAEVDGRHVGAHRCEQHGERAEAGPRVQHRGRVTLREPPAGPARVSPPGAAQPMADGRFVVRGGKLLVVVREGSGDVSRQELEPCRVLDLDGPALETLESRSDVLDRAHVIPLGRA
jgi:hypothetical protein